MEIEIIEKDSNKKGKLFEKMMRELLKSRHYIIDNSNFKRDGMEIDCNAHMDIGEVPVIVECKGWTEKKVQAPDLHKFYGKFSLRRKELNSNNLIGVFFTLSELGPEALKFYERVKREEGKNFLVYPSKKIKELLINDGTIPSCETVRQIVNKEIEETITLEDPKLVFFKDAYYWIQPFSRKNEYFYLVIDCNCDILETKKADKFYHYVKDKINEQCRPYSKSVPEIKVETFLKAIDMLEGKWRAVQMLFDEIDETLHKSEINIAVKDRIMVKKTDAGIKVLDEVFKIREYEKDVFDEVIPFVSNHLVDSFNQTKSIGILPDLLFCLCLSNDIDDVKEYAELLDEKSSDSIDALNSFKEIGIKAKDFFDYFDEEISEGSCYLLAKAFIIANNLEKEDLEEIKNIIIEICKSNNSIVYTLQDYFRGNEIIDELVVECKSEIRDVDLTPSYYDA